MKSLFILLLITLAFSISNSQSTFQLGFTGSYPNYYGGVGNPTYQINWSYYTDMNMNLWQGWWAFTNIK